MAESILVCWITTISIFLEKDFSFYKNIRYIVSILYNVITSNNDRQLIINHHQIVKTPENKM